MELLINDLQALSSKKDIKYVQELMVPLLNMEQEVNVCLHLIDNIHKKEIHDPKKIIKQICK